MSNKTTKITTTPEFAAALRQAIRQLVDERGLAGLDPKLIPDTELQRLLRDALALAKQAVGNGAAEALIRDATGSPAADTAAEASTIRYSGLDVHSRALELIGGDGLDEAAYFAALEAAEAEQATPDEPVADDPLEDRLTRGDAIARVALDRMSEAGTSSEQDFLDAFRQVERDAGVTYESKES